MVKKKYVLLILGLLGIVSVSVNAMELTTKPNVCGAALQSISPESRLKIIIARYHPIDKMVTIDCTDSLESVLNDGEKYVVATSRGKKNV